MRSASFLFQLFDSWRDRQLDDKRPGAEQSGIAASERRRVR